MSPKDASKGNATKNFTVGEPLMNRSHKVCKKSLKCEICMNRCYAGFHGHMFLRGDKNSCACGAFPNYQEAHRFYMYLVRGYQ